jgi:hypothetical protein
MVNFQPVETQIEVSDKVQARVFTYDVPNLGEEILLSLFDAKGKERRARILIVKRFWVLDHQFNPVGCNAQYRCILTCEEIK